MKYNNADVRQKFAKTDIQAGKAARQDFRGKDGQKVLDPDRDRPGAGDRDRPRCRRSRPVRPQAIVTGPPPAIVTGPAPVIAIGRKLATRGPQDAGKAEKAAQGEPEDGPES